MTPPNGGEGRGVLLMAGDDRFSDEVRHELRSRGIRFAEIDPGRVQGMVVPTLVVHGASPAGDVSYEGLGRIRGEYLARYDTSSPGGSSRSPMDASTPAAGSAPAGRAPRPAAAR
jgi:hypothetical protein